MKRILGLLAALLPAAALAAPLPYVNTPLDTVQAAANAVITSINNTNPFNAIPCFVTGAAGAATCNGIQVSITTETLATAANTTYTETLTDSSITAASRIICMSGYGTASGASTAGNPVCGVGVPAAGSATLLVRNASASALNGNINITVFVIN